MYRLGIMKRQRNMKQMYRIHFLFPEGRLPFIKNWVVRNLAQYQHLYGASHDFGRQRYHMGPSVH